MKSIARFLKSLVRPRTVYVPSRRKSSFSDYAEKKAETTARLKHELGRA